MKFKIKICLITLILLLLLTSALNGQIRKLETKNLTLIYLGKPHEYIVPHLARCFENSLGFHRQLFNYTPSEKVTVFLQDFSDYFNGGAISVPRNFIKMNLAPASYVFERVPANERMNHAMSHELIHIVTMDQAAGSDNFFRSLFFWESGAVSKQSNFYSIFISHRSA